MNESTHFSFEYGVPTRYLCPWCSRYEHRMTWHQKEGSAHQALAVNTKQRKKEKKLIVTAIHACRHGSYLVSFENPKINPNELYHFPKGVIDQCRECQTKDWD